MVNKAQDAAADLESLLNRLRAFDELRLINFNDSQLPCLDGRLFVVLDAVMVNDEGKELPIQLAFTRSKRPFCEVLTDEVLWEKLGARVGPLHALLDLRGDKVWITLEQFT